tara:strand:- start:801 stop:1979 length:1179 start_codon:yes stop_codon:yes gene_type:complete
MTASYDNRDRLRDKNNLPIPLLSGDYGSYEVGLRVYIVLYVNVFYTNTLNKMCSDIKNNRCDSAVQEHLQLSSMEINLVRMLDDQLESADSVLLKGFKKLRFWVELVHEVNSTDLYSESENEEIAKGGFPSYINELKRGKEDWFMKIMYSSLQGESYGTFADYIKVEGRLPNGAKELDGELENVQLTNENLAILCLIGGDALDVCCELLNQQPQIKLANKQIFLQKMKQLLLYETIQDCELDDDNGHEETTLLVFRFRLDEQGYETSLPRSNIVKCLKSFELECVLPIWESPAEMISLGESFEVYFQDHINGCEGIAMMRTEIYSLIMNDDEIMKDEAMYIDLAEMFMDRFCQRLCKVTMGDLKRYNEGLVRKDYVRIPYSSFRMSVFSELT